MAKKWSKGGTTVPARALAFAIAVGLVGPVPSRAQLREVLEDRLGGETSAESLPPAATSQDPGPCPESVSHSAGIRSQSCGRVRPPDVAGAPEGALAGLEGVWDIELRGEPDGREMVALLSKGLTHVGFREEAHDWTFMGSMTGPIDALDLPFLKAFGSATIEAIDERSVTVGVAGVRMSVRRTGGASVMTGEWSDPTGSGTAVWRKRPPYEIESVEFLSVSRDAEGRPMRDVVGSGGRPGRLEADHPLSCGGDMLGNCARVYVTVRGRLLAGPHEVWIDPAERFDLVESKFLFHRSDPFPTKRAMPWAIAARRALVGFSLEFAVQDGARPGPKVLWIDGQPLPFHFVVHGYPEDEPRPDLLAFHALGPDSARLEELVEGAPFRLRAEFDGRHPDPWLAVDVPLGEPITRLDAPLGSAEAPAAPTPSRRTRQAVLWRTGDPHTFESDWLGITEADREEGG